MSAWENTGTVVVEGQFPRAAGIGTGATPMGQATLTPNTKNEEEGYGVVRALDPKTLEKKWEFKMNDITWGGRAHHRRRRRCSAAARKATSSRSTPAPARCCGRAALGGQINSGPMSYSVNGNRYVTVAARQRPVRVRAAAIRTSRSKSLVT